MRFTLQGVRLIDADVDLTPGAITVHGSTITAIDQDASASDVSLNLEDAIVCPGFIDVHTHGGGGFSLHTTSVQEISDYARWVPSTGVTSFLIAVVGVPNAFPSEHLSTAVNAIEQTGTNTVAEPLGIHLEGPYINAKRRGAHPTNWLRLPDVVETERLLELTRGHLRLITLAPELPGAVEMIRRLVAAGVTVSIGHTDADYEQTRVFLSEGITHATHCFNAMRPLLHRDPGPLAAIAQSDTVRGELIADGIHVHPVMMDMLVRMLGAERTVVVTDAQSCAGLRDGRGMFAGQTIRCIDGAARLDDGSLAGSALTMDQALRNILYMTSVSLSQAVGMLSANPARSANVDQRKGYLRPGYDADLVILDRDLTLRATLCRGRLTYVAQDWRERFNALIV